MVDSRPALVTDANVWIDLHHGTLVEVVFRLPYRWMTPDLILEELEGGDPSPATLAQFGLEMRVLAGSEIAELARLASVYRRPGRKDLSALVVAKATGAVLLTGDGNLREAAQAESVDVHGVLWLLDRLVDEHALVTLPQVTAAVHGMLNNGSRLPHDEVELRLRRWKG